MRVSRDDARFAQVLNDVSTLAEAAWNHRTIPIELAIYGSVMSAWQLATEFAIEYPQEARELARRMIAGQVNGEKDKKNLVRNLHSLWAADKELDIKPITHPEFFAWKEMHGDKVKT